MSESDMSLFARRMVAPGSMRKSQVRAVVKMNASRRAELGVEGCKSSLQLFR